MKLPIVNSSQISGNKAVLNLALPPETEAFSGHFPNSPILPGVVQVDWALRFANEYLQLEQLAAQDFKVKFNRIISPDMPLVLNLEFVNGRVVFSYQVNGEQMSSGQIKL